MKKIVIPVLALVLLLLPTQNVGAAKTLNQLLDEAKANREAYDKAKNEKALTEKEKEQATNQKSQVQKQIENITAEIEKIGKEIEELQKSIGIKEKEIKKLMEFFQISNGESAYMEYAFGAKSFTDFIYRMSVVEQLSSYNEDLINEYNNNIKQLEEKQKQLTNKQQELNKKQQELTILEAKLDKQIETLTEGMQSKEDEYKTQMNIINSMKKMGCAGNETMAQCQAKIIARTQRARANKNATARGSGDITVTNVHGTYMPISSGYLTSDYGYRPGEFHTGMDFASGYNTNVFPVADGKIINIDYPAYSGACGNHKVYVLHNINGAIYTTSYWHLTSVSVSVGQDVSATTKIGTIAGRGYTDACASGGHVHLNLFRGYTTNNSGRINPRIIIPQTPGTYVHFSHR